MKSKKKMSPKWFRVFKNKFTNALNCRINLQVSSQSPKFCYIITNFNSLFYVCEKKVFFFHQDKRITSVDYRLRFRDHFVLFVCGINICSDVETRFNVWTILRCCYWLKNIISGMHFPSMISLTSQRLHESERASFFSVLISGSALGILLCGSIGSYFLEHYGWSLVFQLLGKQIYKIYYVEYFWNYKNFFFSIHSGGISVVWTAILYYHSMSINSNRVCKKSPTNELPWRQLWTKPSFWYTKIFSIFLPNN